MSNSQHSLRLIGCLFVCLCLSLTYAAGFGAYQFLNRPADDYSESFDVFWEAWDQVDQHFYAEAPTAQERTYAAIRGALQSLDDPYTIFVEPQPRELERDHMRGSFGGIGVDLWRDADGQMAISPYPDSPAEQAGILKGDILLAVDGDEVDSDTTVDDVRALLHGEVGMSVALTLSRPPAPPFDLTITRKEIQVPSVSWRVLDQAPDIGYVHVTGFTERTKGEVVTAIGDLRDADIDSLILDLRHNYGGLISPAVDTASQFLREGVVLYEQWRGEDEERTFAVRGGGVALDIPMVALINGGTASAAEIVAGALQDHGRAPLIGEATFGKGSVQLIYELSDGSSVHVTSAIWLTPDKHKIDGVGLVPDVRVASSTGTQDVQLDRAIDYLRSRSD
jgi:carboxyl-terminal processing protease